MDIKNRKKVKSETVKCLSQLLVLDFIDNLLDNSLP